MRPKAYSYIRFSTPEQAKGDSLRRQLEQSEKYCKEHGLVLDDTLRLTDRGLSAYHGIHKTKGMLGEFLKRVENGGIPEGSVLIVESLDRLSREEILTALNQFTGIIQAGIQLVTLADGQVYDRESINDNWTQLIIYKLKMLEEHTLDAVFSLPSDMFHPGASAVACCMIFNLGTRHENAPIKETFFGYYKDDGFEKRKNLGRMEKADGLWRKTEGKWLNLYFNRITEKSLSVTKKVTAGDEWLAEAYMEADYNKLNQDDFQKVLNQYLGYLVSNGRL